MKIPKKIKKAIFTTVLTLTMVVQSTPISLFANQKESPKGYVTATVEKFTLGLGYVQEPIKVPFYEGDTYADITVRLLGENNVSHWGDTKSDFYLSKIRDNDDREPNVPEYILEVCDGITGKQDPEWLGEFDYANFSGWMYAVENSFPNVGASDAFPEDGEVLRWQFTLYGMGVDIGADGFGMSQPLIEIANRDNLTEEVAEINSAENKEELLEDKEIKEAYEEAYKVLEDLTSEQEEVDSIYEKLSKAVDEETNKPENPEDSTTPENPGDSDETEKPGIDVVIPSISVDESIEKSSAYMYAKTPNPKIGTGGGEWTILSLSRGGYNVDSNYYGTYYKNVVNELKDKKGELSKAKYTEYSRVILGLSSIGKNATKVGGYNLIEKLADYNSVTKQGINGPIFAILALDSNNYEIPQVEGVSKQSTRDNLIEFILDKEITQADGTVGGWALSGKKPDPDITAMALQALSNYKDSTITKTDGTEVAVKPYIDRAVEVLSNLQLENGGYSSWGTENVESASQVLVALTSLGIDPKTDERFIKGDGNWLVSNIISYQSEDGGFAHTKGDKTNAIATDQATYALVAYKRFVEGKNKLYNMTDMFTQGEVITPQEDEVAVKAPIRVSGKEGTEFDITLKSGYWSKDNIKLIDSVIDIPSSVDITRVEVSKNLTGGSLNYGVEDNKLRLVYTNTDLSSLSYEEGDFLTLNCKLNKEVEVTRASNEGLTFKVNGVNLRDSSESSTEMELLNDTITIPVGEEELPDETPDVPGDGGEENPDNPGGDGDSGEDNPGTGDGEEGGDNDQTPDSTPEAEVVEVKALYTGDGTDLIEKNQTAYAITFLNLSKNEEISFNEHVKLYYSQELTDKNSNTTYIALVDDTVKEEDLKEVKNYTINKEKEAESILFGDTNGDGLLNAQDALNILTSWTRETEQPSKKGIIVKNVNGDGKIDTSDVLLVMEKYMQDKVFSVLSK